MCGENAEFLLLNQVIYVVITLLFEEFTLEITPNMSYK
jgi:hypothetical protein